MVNLSLFFLALFDKSWSGCICSFYLCYSAQATFVSLRPKYSMNMEYLTPMKFWSGPTIRENTFVMSSYGLHKEKDKAQDKEKHSSIYDIYGSIYGSELFL